MVALALVALVFVIWRVDSAPSTNDAYASADTIDVVPEVSGRIVELAVTDNQAVKQGDLLFRIDPRPYEANLAKAEASLAALDKQIMLTQRSVDAQQFGADSVNCIWKWRPFARRLMAGSFPSKPPSGSLHLRCALFLP